MTATNYFLVLDIETSKKMLYDFKLQKEMPVAVWLSYGICKLYDTRGNSIEKCYFRKWEELEEFFKYIYKSFLKQEIYCYVHNLSYEFDFLIKNISKPKDFICNSSHSVICANLEKYPYIKFRCTLQLSTKSLAKIGEELNLPKLEDTYANILPNEEIPQKRIDYCERDCDIVAKYVVYELKEYKSLFLLPLTNTGRVRKDLKKLLKEYKPKYDWNVLPPKNCYDALVKSYRGAITMSNPQFTNIHIKQKMRCYDETSKYPSIMLAEQFPYTIKKLNYFDNDTYKDYKFWIGRLRIYDVYSKYQWGCISVSTIENTTDMRHECFNGKIIASDVIDLYITNVDFEYITKVYNYSRIEFIELYKCEDYDYLPEAFYKLIEKYAKPKYELKLKLKDLEKQGKENTEEYRETEILYMKSKNMLNAIYGMMVQKLTQSEYEIDDMFMWHEIKQEYNDKGARVNRNFLYGIYITAYSRRDLILNIVENCPYNFVYCDTDSIKYIDEGKEFNDLNKSIRYDYVDKPYFNNFNKFDEEEPYQEFKTYGAKKYAYIKNDVFHFTVAGLPKRTEIKSFDEFKLNTTYKNCKLGKRFIYIEDYVDSDYVFDDFGDKSRMKNETISYLQENQIITNGGVALVETDYTLDMTKEDLFYIERYEKLWR